MFKLIGFMPKSDDELTSEHRKVIQEFFEAARKTVDDYRREFKHSLAGHWSRTLGTSALLVDEHWVFRPDHTGRIVETGVHGVELDETLFEWKEVADLTIACRVTRWPDDDITEGQKAQMVEWDIVHYDFKTVPTEVGAQIVLYEVLRDETLQNGFWLSTEPLGGGSIW